MKTAWGLLPFLAALSWGCAPAGQQALQAQSRPALLRRQGIAAFTLAPGGIGERVGFITPRPMSRV